MFRRFTTAIVWVISSSSVLGDHTGSGQRGAFILATNVSR
jgi:hypothetical protein